MGVAGAANGRDKVGTQVAEQAMDAALILMIGGLGIYLTIWSGHHVVPYPDGPGEWRPGTACTEAGPEERDGTRRDRSRYRAGRQREDVPRGLLTYTGVVYPVSVFAAWVMVEAWALALISWGLIGLRARRWQRRGGDKDDHPV